MMARVCICRNFRIGISQTAAAVPQHGIDLAQLLDLGRDLLEGYAHLLGQTRAIIEAAMNVRAAGIPVHVEIMVPLVGNHKELRYQKNIIDRPTKVHRRARRRYRI